MEFVNNFQDIIDAIESKFIDYCAKLGVEPDNVKRRYWRLKGED